MNSVNRLAAPLMGLVVILLPFFIILSAVNLFCSEQFVQYEYSQQGFPPAQRFNSQDRLTNSIQTVRYVRGDISEQDLRDLKIFDQTTKSIVTVYNQREVKHLVDVRNVWSMTMTFGIIASILIAAALIALAWSPLTRLWAARALFYGGIASIVVILFIGIFSVVNFDQFFIQFHHIFFEGDSWLFNYTDSLIQFYPEQFWTSASYGIALFCGIASVVITAIGWLWQRSLYRQAAAAPQPASA